jgi:Tol biopolymer transport system component
VVAPERTVVADRVGDSPSISGDGRFVAFELPTRHGFVRVYVRDLVERRTVLVSRATGIHGQRLFGQSPSISTDGRYVAYVGDAAPEQSGIAVRDRVANTTVLASPGGFFPSISADGRFVAYTSTAPRPDATGFRSDVFVRDLVSGTTALASRASGESGAAGNGDSTSPSISADGRLVAFDSDATNLDPADTNPGKDIFIRDLETPTTTLVTRPPGRYGPSRGFESSDPAISADGAFVAFTSSRDPDRWPDPWRVVLLRDLRAQTTSLVSRASGRRGFVGNAFEPSISAKGRLVAFTGHGELHPYDYNGAADVYVRDVKAQTTVLASRSSGALGARGNSYSASPALSADGRVVAFASVATDLHPDKRGDQRGAFARGLTSPPLPPPPRARCDGRLATTIVLPTGDPLGLDQDVLVYGSDLNVIRGSRRGEWIESENGRSRICGRGGGDLITTDGGNDRIFGGAGPDFVIGGAGRDYLVGGSGDDVLDARTGRDRIFGGAGDDFIPTAGVTPDRVDCGPGDDRAIVDPRDRVRNCELVRVRSPRAH